ncbi:hypothetical protein M422DRAFT_268542 [Sphaerobolus stellatus SS14]|uniref:Uncharacterized protein n=1 Tax=Sphaerobolus stellatus (strain SS14) TaxID=990650 RepID=A0A0C9UMD8_SPHS4|nr:hypothetical protein M422DRAFT_268542 [Sphaerobolus stellatus SS14]
MHLVGSPAPRYLRGRRRNRCFFPSYSLHLTRFFAFRSIHATPSTSQTSFMTENNGKNNITPTQTRSGSTINESEPHMTQSSDESNLTSSEIVKQCLMIVEQRRKGKIDTGEAGVFFYDIIPSSEEGDRALNITAGTQLPSTSGQAGEPDEPNGHSDNEEQIKSTKSKKGFNESGLLWFGKSDPILDPKIRKTLERKCYYLIDPKQVKQSLCKGNPRSPTEITPELAEGKSKVI